jgi:hypothetical protein
MACISGTEKYDLRVSSSMTSAGNGDKEIMSDRTACLGETEALWARKQ